MSLVGPRPERPEFLDQINKNIPDFNLRTKVKPGLTGLAQTRYSYGFSMRDIAIKFKYDLLYLEKMCFSLDFLISLWTIGRIFTGKGIRQ